jgi:NodT family efflux transporter outer membrane factor (OMF) lipoprotein
MVLTNSCWDRRRAETIPVPNCALSQAIQDSCQDKVLVESDEWIRQDWWNLFDDPQLTCFIETALTNNPTLQAARARIILAAANADRMRASLFPNFTWGADVAREKLSKTGVVPFGNVDAPVNPGTGPNRIPEYFTQYETQLTLDYEFDLWGKNRNSVRAALGEMAARIADSAFADLQMSYWVARVYFKLQTEYRLRAIAKAVVENRERYFQLIAERVKRGIDTALTRNTAQSNLSLAKQALLVIEGDIAVHEHELKTYLAGDFQEEIACTQVIEKSLPKIPLPVDLPLHLIAKRPDIASQIWLIESASRTIDVAEASFYPDFSLMALFGFQTIHFQELFKWPSTYFNIDPAVSLPIFDGGRRMANLEGSRVNYDLAVFEYNNRILNAVKEVLDGLAILRNTEAQFEQFKEVAALQENNYRLTLLRTANKIDSELVTLLAKEQFLKAEEREVRSSGQTVEAVLSLIKAIGGGYDSANCAM